MKRHGELMPKVADAENLRLAFWKAAKGKRGKPDCQAFRERLDENLETLGAELLSGGVSVGNYHYFRVHDPKERLICAAALRERVLQHALMNVCEPVLERAAVFDSYACRKGKGQMLAVERAQGHARTHRWFLKMDIRMGRERARTARGPRAGAVVSGGGVATGTEVERRRQPDGLRDGFSWLSAVSPRGTAGTPEQGAVCAEVPAV